MEQIQYEFTEAQNQSLRVLADRMKWVGIFLIVIGAIYGVSGVLGIAEGGLAFTLIINAAILILIGIWTRNAGNSFSLIVETTGSDIPHLMEALESLRKLYTLAFWMTIVAVAAMVIMLLVGLFVS